MKQLTEEVYTGQGFMQGGWGLLNFVMGGEAQPPLFQVPPHEDFGI